jgi:hypothetical protein
MTLHGALGLSLLLDLCEGLADGGNRQVEHAERPRDHQHHEPGQGQSLYRFTPILRFHISLWCAELYVSTSWRRMCVGVCLVNA